VGRSWKNQDKQVLWNTEPAARQAWHICVLKHSAGHCPSLKLYSGLIGNYYRAQLGRTVGAHIYLRWLPLLEVKYSFSAGFSPEEP
jgi:hypothetical protein